jgi:hypothetical protein
MLLILQREWLRGSTESMTWTHRYWEPIFYQGLEQSSRLRLRIDELGDLSLYKLDYQA